jgi:hypothetical protein
MSAPIPVCVVELRIPRIPIAERGIAHTPEIMYNIITNVL